MKDLKLDDYSIIKPYLDLANYEGYNSNFVTMMMWNHEYHIQYEIHEHFLVMLHNYKGTYFWAMPFTSSEYYKDAIDYMIDYSQNNGFDFIIDCAIESFVEQIKKIYDQKFLFERTEYNDDYIYDRQMLETLSGKKMQKRRNHYNYFIKEYPHYIYKDLDIVNDFDIILECLNRWENEKDDISESMTSEIRGIMYLLSSKHILDFEVGGIFIEGRMEAFIIASRLKHSTVQIHVEKANKEIRGLYPAILKEMLEHHYSNELYVNREEDMGLENLRKSKKALHPVKMIHKYRITSQNITLSQASDDDKNSIQDLWLENFQDETLESTDFYFQNIYNKNHTYILKNNNQLISVIQLNEMNIKKGNEIQKCYFILGVCTKKGFEGQGFMKKIMNYVLEKYKSTPIYLQAYVPDIYRKFGFYASHYHQNIVIKSEELYDFSLQTCNDFSLLNNYYTQYVERFDEYRLRDDCYWDIFIKRCEVFEDHILIFKDYGYLIYHEDENEIRVGECVYLDSSYVMKMLSSLKTKNKSVIVECDLTLDIPGYKSNTITMMSNQIKSDTIQKDKFINEIY